MSKLNTDMDRLDRKINKLAVPKSRSKRGTWTDETGTHHAGIVFGKEMPNRTNITKSKSTKKGKPSSNPILNIIGVGTGKKVNKTRNKRARKIFKKNWKILWG